MQRDPYAEALDEFESGNPDRAALARATVNAAGNADRLKAEYIKIRVKTSHVARPSWGDLSDEEKEQRAEELFLAIKAVAKRALIVFVVLGVIGMGLAVFGLI